MTTSTPYASQIGNPGTRRAAGVSVWTTDAATITGWRPTRSETRPPRTLPATAASAEQV